ncbi:hypothetical protein [Marinobacter vinifirmus]|uniref:Glycosyltransferase family 2 protein n=1 Tax=Marinobacter vinifirmus TaxID=355591 RepID=A0A558B352_9GAMM|nr:hypothetical protein [Marinobacter vinifirmus]TVT30942.1 MAG: hypothetical protein FHK81_15925 [Marinobacter vinifirmus]
MLTVNLTTTFQRLGLCRIALASLLLQSRLPDQINLWVSKEPYLRDKGIAQSESIDQLIGSLPAESRSRVSVRWVPNTGPYRKLIPMLREAGPDDLIVTADDDIFYGRDWLSGLLVAYEDAGGKPVAARVRTKRINFLGKKTSYLFWNLINQPKTVQGDFIVTFGGGVVLTRAMFREQDIADDSFLKVAPTADDLWYSKLLQMHNQDVVVVPSLLGEINFIIHDDGLVNHNFSRASSLLEKIRLHFFDKFLGYFGFPVCGNDFSYKKVREYFDRSKD